MGLNKFFGPCYGCFYTLKVFFVDKGPSIFGSMLGPLFLEILTYNSLGL